MFTLRNDALSVDILDPVADRARFGTRYCTAGYIFQIEDAARGPLLTGPTYPESFNTFDGQGIPDAFNQIPLRDRAYIGPDALILGIGVCNMVENRVTEFAAWEIEHDEGRAVFATTHSFQDFEIRLSRRVSLSGRTVRSWTSVANRGKGLIPLSWFPHPFFPQPADNELCAFNIPVRFPENEGYEFGPNGFIRRRGPVVSRGHFQALEHEARAALTVLQRHPALGLIGAQTSYVPAFFPIWGNARTFSWEPYFERMLASGERVEWWIDYSF